MRICVYWVVSDVLVSDELVLVVSGLLAVEKLMFSGNISRMHCMIR